MVLGWPMVGRTTRWLHRATGILHHRVVLGRVTGCELVHSGETLWVLCLHAFGNSRWKTADERHTQTAEPVLTVKVARTVGSNVKVCCTDQTEVTVETASEFADGFVGLLGDVVHGSER